MLGKEARDEGLEEDYEHVHPQRKPTQDGEQLKDPSGEEHRQREEEEQADVDDREAQHEPGQPDSSVIVFILYQTLRVIILG